MTIILSDLRRDHVGAELETSIALRIGDDCQRLSIFHGGDFGALADIAPEFDPFLTLLLIPAMSQKTPIVVEGSIDARRLDGLRRGVQTVLSDECEPVSARTMKPLFMPQRVDATRRVLWRR